MRPHSLRHAFTLVEMSIVLVIIGLLVGGVLTGQSLIRNGELSTMMNETKYYINAFNQFQTKYNAIPGDMADAASNWSAGLNGDGNGQLLSSANSGSIALPEVLYAFEHLALSGIISGSYTGATSSFGTFAALAGTNVPASSLQGVAYLLDHPDYTDGTVAAADAVYPPSSVAGLYGHVLRVAGLSPTSTSMPALGFLSGEEGLSLDNKFDDGLPNTGTMLTPRFGTTGSCAAAALATSAYSISITGKNCFLILRIQ